MTFQHGTAAEQTWRTDFTLLARIKDAKGEVVRKASQPYRLSGPAAQLEASKRGDMLFFRQPELPPGTYTLESVVHDALSTEGRRGDVARSSCPTREARRADREQPVDRAAEREGPRQREAADNPLYFGDLLLYPEPGRAVAGRAADKTLSFFHDRGPRARRARRAPRLEILQKGQSLAQLPMELTKPDATGRISHAGQLPLASFPVGEYVLRVDGIAGRAKGSARRDVHGRGLADRLEAAGWRLELALGTRLRVRSARPQP